MPKSATKAAVFIIESLDLSDEKNNSYEGQILSQILHLSNKESMYYYIRTKKELEFILKEFEKMNYRYLHLSCHGDTRSISTTLDTISFSELQRIVQPYLKGKRLFVSACSAVNENLARTLIPPIGCLSVIGPDIKILFSDAAIIWASFYHLVFKKDQEKMTKAEIRASLQKIANTFGISLKYYSISKKSKTGFREVRIEPRKRRKRLQTTRHI